MLPRIKLWVLVSKCSFSLNKSRLTKKLSQSEAIFDKSIFLVPCPLYPSSKIEKIIFNVNLKLGCNYDITSRLSLRALRTMRLRRTLTREQDMSVVTITTPSTIPSELYQTPASLSLPPRLRKNSGPSEIFFTILLSQVNAKLISWALKLPRKWPALEGTKEKK